MTHKKPDKAFAVDSSQYSENTLFIVTKKGCYIVSHNSSSSDYF